MKGLNSIVDNSVAVHLLGQLVRMLLFACASAMLEADAAVQTKPIGARSRCRSLLLAPISPGRGTLCLGVAYQNTAHRLKAWTNWVRLSIMFDPAERYWIGQKPHCAPLIGTGDD